MTPTVIVSVVSLVLCLVLAARGLRGSGLEPKKALTMGLIWVALIAGLALVLSRFAG